MSDQVHSCWVGACPDRGRVQWKRCGDTDDEIHAVFACHAHTLPIEAAALLHQSDCAPGEAPGECRCTPEAAVQDVPEVAPELLPPGW